MLLSDRDILAEIDAGRVSLDPFERTMIQPSSIDVIVAPVTVRQWALVAAAVLPPRSQINITFFENAINHRANSTNFNWFLVRI